MHLELIRESARELPALESPGRFTSARLWFCKYRTLQPLETLANMQELEIAGYSDPDFEPLSHLEHLSFLRVLHLPQVRSLDGLAGLAKLECLSLATLPSWDSSGKVLKIDGFQPLAQLSALKHFESFGIVPDTGGLKPFTELPNLESARFSKIAKREVAAFYERTGISDDFVPKPRFTRG